LVVQHEHQQYLPTQEVVEALQPGVVKKIDVQFDDVQEQMELVLSIPDTYVTIPQFLHEYQQD
jgi:hypothetical protein